MAKFKRFGRAKAKLHAEQCPVRTRNQANYYNYLPVKTPKKGFPEGELCKVCHQPTPDKRGKRKVAKRQYLFEDSTKARQRWEHVYPQFYRAVNSAYHAIMRQKPDLMIVPMRGAQPLERSVRLLASLDRHSSQMPKTIHMKTGRISGIGAAISFDRKRKKEFFQERLLQALRSGNHRRLLLFDEARSGGSISMQTRWIQEALEKHQKETGRKVELRCIAIAERTPKCKAYNELQQKGILQEFSLDKLFTIDSPHFLTRIVLPKGEKEPHIIYRGSKSRQTLENLLATLQKLHLEKSKQK